jgi:DNA-binding NarL/FixJ family response regulator
MRYTVCLVDDDWFARKTLSTTIPKCKDFELTKAYENGKDALQDLPKVNPDIVLMDIKLPDMSGIKCLQQLRALSPPFESCILMLTDYQNENLIFDALHAGANGYLSKENASKKELERAMCEALAGGAPMSPGIAQKVLAFFRSPGSPASHSTGGVPPKIGLTPRQTEILDLLTRGLMYKDIANTLGISLDSVRKHVQAVFLKLHVHSRAEVMLRYAARIAH